MKTQTDTQQGEETAILNCRIRRQPASLANYHYHIEAGKTLYVIDRMDHRTIVSSVPKPHRCSEDVFYIPTKYLDFQQGERAFDGEDAEEWQRRSDEQGE